MNYDLHQSASVPNIMKTYDIWWLQESYGYEKQTGYFDLIEYYFFSYFI